MIPRHAPIGREVEMAIEHIVIIVKENHTFEALAKFMVCPRKFGNYATTGSF
jgi:hypothetical protein